ncbi:MAG TPA: BTAD domain-containing putative transcriptional regulator [Jatrophihabitans sp.]|nr:BTAD domain-containing putative transcriptional regulator [Jatrophihabitans sp.]
MADVVRIQLLGSFAASSQERQVPSSGWRLRKAKTLVKLLALDAAHTVHVEQAADTLWPDRDRAAARNNLHQALHAARRALSTLGVDGAAVLTLRDDLLAFGRDVEVRVDVDELRAAVSDAVSAGDIEGLTTLLHDSAPELLPEDAYEPWLQPHVIAFRAWRTQLALDVANKQTEAGAGEKAVVLLTPITETDRLNEPAVRALMRALTASGRRSEALLAYERLRAELREQLGSDPEPQTRALFRDVLTGSSDEQPGGGRAGVLTHQPAGNLPAPMSSLVGRAPELDDVASTLRRTRLLTLTGMGGIGKTTLATALARRVAGDYPDGAYLVELGALRSGDQVAPQLARTLRLALPADSSPVDAIVAQLRSRSLLVVLDNCEHLLDACAPVVSELLRGCAGVRVVATSREPLRIEGEVSWRTPSLALPARDCADCDELRRAPSVDLFVQRAAAALPGFTLHEGNATAVSAICHRLDGIPLALELAAACVPLLAPEQIAERLSDAMALLRRGDRALTRQQTLEATLTWSHELLTAEERALFRRLAVFAGSFTLDAVEAVAADGTDGGAGLPAGAVMSALGRLVDTSLVVADQGAEVTRYRLLDTVRQYALHQLRASHEQLDVERRHCEWYRAFAAARDPELHLFATVVPASLDVEHDNLRAALAWALRHDPRNALELAVSLWRYWLARGFLAEGRRWIEAALDNISQPSCTRARALLALAAFDIRRGTGERLHELGAEAVAIQRSLGDQRGLAESLGAEAVFAYLLGAWDDCWQRTVDSRAVASAVGAVDLEIGARHLQGIVRAAQGRLDDAREAFDEIRGLLPRVNDAPRPFLRPVSQGFAVSVDADGEPRVYFEETVLHGRIVGAQHAEAHVLCNLADLTRAAGDLDDALRLLRQAEELFTALDDTDGQAVALSRRGCLHRVRGEYAAGRDALTQSLALREASGERRAIALARTNLGLLLVAEGDVDEGRRAIEAQIERARAIRDVAAQVGMTLTLASACADAGDDAGADVLLRDVVEPQVSLPGCHLPITWALLMHARILDRLGRPEAADAARADARHRAAVLGLVGAPLGLEPMPTVKSPG